MQSLLILLCLCVCTQAHITHIDGPGTAAGDAQEYRHRAIREVSPSPPCAVYVQNTVRISYDDTGPQVSQWRGDITTGAAPVWFLRLGLAQSYEVFNNGTSGLNRIESTEFFNLNASIYEAGGFTQGEVYNFTIAWAWASEPVLYTQAISCDQGVQLTPLPTPSNSPIPSATPSPTKTPTLTPSPTVSLTPTNTPTPTGTQSPSRSPTSTLTPTRTPTVSPSPTGTQSPSRSPTSSVSLTPTSTPTVSPSPTGTQSPSLSPTRSPTVSLTPTNTPTPTGTQSPSRSPTSTLTPTRTPTVSPSPTGTRSPSLSATPSSTVSLTPTGTGTPSLSPSGTPSLTTSATPSPSSTVSPTPSSPTGSRTPSLTRIGSPTASPSPSSSPQCRVDQLDYSVTPLSFTFQATSVTLSFNFTLKGSSARSVAVGQSPILPCVINQISIGERVCSLTALTWGAGQHFSCTIYPPEAAQTLAYPVPIAVRLNDTVALENRLIAPTQTRFNTFTWLRTQTRMRVSIPSFNVTAFTFAARAQLATFVANILSVNEMDLRISSWSVTGVTIQLWDSASLSVAEQSLRLIANRLELVGMTGLNITEIVDLGSGFDTLCDPTCLNDGQCRNASGLAYCECATGYFGSDCSSMRVPEGGTPPDRGYIANAADTPNMAMSAASGNTSMTMAMSWTNFGTTAGQRYDLDTTRLSQSLESTTTDDGETIISFQSRFNDGETTASTTFSVSNSSRQVTFAGQTLTIPAGAVKNGLEFIGPPPFTVVPDENIVLELALDLGTESVVSTSDPVRSDSNDHLFTITMVLSNGFYVDLRYLDQAILDDEIVEVTVTFNSSTKALSITTAPWESTWVYDPDFNVLFGTTETESGSSDDFPLGIVAGAAVGGAAGFVGLVLVVLGTLWYVRARRNKRDTQPTLASINFASSDVSTDVLSKCSSSSVLPPISSAKKRREMDRSETFARNKQSVWEDLIDADPLPSPTPADLEEDENSVEMKEQPPPEATPKGRRYPTYDLHNNTIYRGGPAIEKSTDNPVFDQSSPPSILGDDSTESA